MKKGLLIAAMVFAGSSAFASAGLHFNAGYVNTTAKSGSSESNMSLFAPSVILGDFGGKVGSADFKLMLDFAQLHLGVNDQFVNQACISKSVDSFKFSVGKLAINAGGFEKKHHTFGETYFTSLANSGGLVTTAKNNLGFGFDWMMGDHALSFQALNQTNNEYTAADLSTPATVLPNKRHSMGVQYKGSFADKKVTLLVGQMAGAEDDQTSGAQSTLTFVGLNLALVENLSIEIENLSNTFKRSTAGALADATTSLLAEFRYNAGMYTPVFKYESSENKDNEDSTLATSKKRTAMGLALEIKPSDDDFKYYVAYNTSTDKPGNTGATDTTGTTLMAGLAFNGDFLK